MTLTSVLRDLAPHLAWGLLIRQPTMPTVRARALGPEPCVGSMHRLLRGPAERPLHCHARALRCQWDNDAGKRQRASKPVAADRLLDVREVHPRAASARRGFTSRFPCIETRLKKRSGKMYALKSAGSTGPPSEFAAAHRRASSSCWVREFPAVIRPCSFVRRVYPDTDATCRASTGASINRLAIQRRTRSLKSCSISGAEGGTRTHDRRFTKPMLYH
jgi:hypothetical protein